MKHVCMLKCASKTLEVSAQPAFLDMKAAKIQALWRRVKVRGRTTLALTQKFLALGFNRDNIMAMRYCLLYLSCCRLEA